MRRVPTTATPRIISSEQLRGSSVSVGRIGEVDGRGCPSGGGRVAMSSNAGPRPPSDVTDVTDVTDGSLGRAAPPAPFDATPSAPHTQVARGR